MYAVSEGYGIWRGAYPPSGCSYHYVDKEGPRRRPRFRRWHPPQAPRPEERPRQLQEGSKKKARRQFQWPGHKDFQSELSSCLSAHLHTAARKKLQEKDGEAFRMVS
jgi:hypothetical protein